LTNSARDTPMMRHFRQIKAQNPDAIVLYAASRPPFVVDAYARRLLGRPREKVVDFRRA